jgi:hypothetical protein
VASKTSNQQPATSNQQPATSNQQLISKRIRRHEPFSGCFSGAVAGLSGVAGWWELLF